MSLRLINNKGQYTSTTPNELRLAGKNTWKGWSCSIGINAMHIDLSGDVWGATCRVGGKIGSIHDSPFQIMDVPLWTTCTKNMCGCAADIRLPKIKEEIYFDLISGCCGDYVDEIDDYQALDWTADVVHVSWDLGKWCNYECSYCPPYLHDKTSPHLPFEKVIEVLDTVMNYYKGRKVEFSFAGGEPTMHPRFVDICRYITEKGSSSLITTNGSRSLEYLVDLSQHLSLMIISHHFEYIKLEKMVSKISSLIERTTPGTRYIIRLMMKPGMVNEIHEFTKTYRKYIKYNNVAFEFTPLRQQKPNRDLIVNDYTSGELTLMQEIQQAFK